MADESTQSATQQLSIPEFAAKIKQRDPRLANVSDEDLTRKVFERRPELMKYVKTQETRMGHEKVGEPGVVGATPGADGPGIGTRYGQAVGIPTTKAEAVSAAHPFAMESLGAPDSAGNKLLELGASATGAAPVAMAGKAAYAYSNLLYSTAKNLADSAKSNYEDVSSGKKSLRQGMEDVNQSESDFLLKGLTSIIGGNAVANGIEDAKTKNYNGLAGDALGFATVMLLMKSGGGKKSAMSVGEDAVRENERLASLMDHVTGVPDRETMASTVKPILKQAIEERGGNEVNLDPGFMKRKGKFPSRKGAPAQTGPDTWTSNLRQGAREVLKTADHAVDITNRPFEQVLQTVGNEPVPQNVRAGISKGLREIAGDYSKVGDEGLTRALNGLADTVDQTKTIRELHEIKVHANKEMQNMQGLHTPGGSFGASVQTAYAYKLAADGIREGLYPVMEDMSGVNLHDYGAREHAAIGFRDGVYSKYFQEIDPQQASESAFGYLRGIAHGSKYTRHVIERAIRLNPMPAGEFNLQFRKGVGPIGKGAAGESIRVFGKPMKGLLSGDTLKFKIPGDLPKEIFTGGSGADPQMSYAGRQEVPNPTHTPMQGSARYPQRQQLGTTEGTISESIFKRNAARTREQDAIGSLGTSTPERLFTGEPTKTESRWQYLTGAKGPTQEVAIAGPGTFETSSVETAYTTLQRLKTAASGQDFMKYPFEVRAKIRDTIATLQDQIDTYMANRKRTPPKNIEITPAKPGMVTPPRTKRAIAVGLQAEREGNQSEAQQ